MAMRNRIVRLEWLDGAHRRPLTAEEMTDAELCAEIDALSPPGSKPSALWTDDELQSEIERLKRDDAE